MIAQLVSRLRRLTKYVRNKASEAVKQCGFGITLKTTLFGTPLSLCLLWLQDLHASVENKNAKAEMLPAAACRSYMQNAKQPLKRVPSEEAQVRLQLTRIVLY